MGTKTWKLFGTGGAILSGIVAKKLATVAWQKGTGSQPPANPEDPDTSWGAAMGWAMVTGALVGVARMLTARRAAKSYRKSTGQLPPGLHKAG